MVPTAALAVLLGLALAAPRWCFVGQPASTPPRRRGAGPTQLFAGVPINPLDTARGWGFNPWELPTKLKSSSPPQRIPLTPLQRQRAKEREKMSPEERKALESAPEWWEEASKTMVDSVQATYTGDNLARLRKQMTVEQAAFDEEINDIVIRGKRALLRLRMMKAYRSPLWRPEIYKQIKVQIRRAEQLRRKREIARGITKMQSKRIQRRRNLELKVQYEDAYGRSMKSIMYRKSNRWKRRWGLMV